MKHSFFTSIIIFIIFSVFLPTISIASTTSASDLNQKINTTQSQIDAIDQEIVKYQNEISKTNEQSQTLSNLIKELNLTRSKLLKEKEKTSKQITATGLVIESIGNDILSKEQIISKEKDILKKLLYNLYKEDNKSVLETMLLQESLSEASNAYYNTIAINTKVTENISVIAKMRDDLTVSKTQKETEQSKLQSLKKNLTYQQMGVEASKTAQNKLLVETKNKESNYKALLLEQQKKRDAFEQSLRDYETQLKFILNPSLLPPQGSSILSWPLSKIFITQLFGKTVSSKRLYISGSHSGVDFRASIGTQVMAMASGTIVGTGNTDLYCKGASFGKWVFIKYNNGLSSTFGHLSVILGTAGQTVSKGDVVGLSGNTGHSTGPHLHVTVYASQGADVKTVPSLSCSGKTFIMPIASVNAYLDPMLYLPKTTSNMFKNDTPRD